MRFKLYVKKSVSFILIFCLMLAFFSTPKRVSAETTYGYINGNGVNVREGPSTKHSSLGKLSFVNVEVLEKVENGQDATGWGTVWYKIKYNTTVGYVYGEFLDIIDPPPIVPIDPDFEESLKKFPESYHAALRALKAQHPNWNFFADELSLSFEQAVDGEELWPRKLVPSGYNSSWKSMGKDKYDWLNNKWYNNAGNWNAASREVIAYYMDPRNFLNLNDIYMFAKQSYAGSETAEGLGKVVAGTFLSEGYPDDGDGFGGSYIKVIMEAAKQSGMSPYVIAATIILEQGSSGKSQLISGTYEGSNGELKGYYNFFNYGASGTTNTDVIVNGLTFAKSQDWSTRAKAIIGGASRSATRYIAAGQDTYYYMNFDVKSEPYFTMQYAQNIEDSKGKGAQLRKYYGAAENADAPLNFSIPVYKDMPESAAPAVEKTDKLNNYYFSNIGIDGFDMYKNEYELSVSGDTRISYAVPNGAEYIGEELFKLNAGSNTLMLTVKSQTGYTRNYILKVTAEKECYIAIGENELPPEETTIKLGDTNRDGKISIVDLANIQKHLLGVITLSGDGLTAGDTNKDGKISIVDLANVQKHLLGIIVLE